MPTANISRGLIPKLEQLVRVAGADSGMLTCTGINKGSGIGATTADFSAPEYLWDQVRFHMRGALVQVWFYSDSVSLQSPDFCGFLDVDSSEVSEDDDTVSFSARSMSHYLRAWRVGLSSHEPVVSYPLTDLVTGRPTTWSPRRILEDLMSSLPTFYKPYIWLGDTRVINTTSQNMQAAMVFRDQTYEQAIMQLLELFGDVTIRERFNDSGACVLDFYRIQDLSQPQASVTVCEWNDPITAGANVARIAHNQSVQDSCTRIVAYGTPRRFIVTVRSVGEDAYILLLPDWNPDLETAVLANPASQNPNSPGYVEGMEFVFRRYRLPACFNGYVKLKELPVLRANGTPYSAQCSISKFTMAPAVAGGYTGEKSATEWVKTGFECHLDKGYILLNKSAIGVTLLTQDVSGNPVTTYQQADVQLTFAFEGPCHIYADTGQDYSSGIALPFAIDGLADTVLRDDKTYCQYTNANTGSEEFGLLAPDGTRKYFPAMIYNLDTEAWVAEMASAVVVRDDTRELETIARDTLRERNRVHHSFDITIPWFTRGYEPGYRNRVYNQTNAESGTYVITQVSYSYGLDGEHSTQVTVDNVKPPHRSKHDLRGGGH